MILITTAGKVGSEASRLLGERRVQVRVLVRNPEKAAALAQAGVEVFDGVNFRFHLVEMETRVVLVHAANLS